MPSQDQLNQWIQEAHDKGQKDGANRTFDAPYEDLIYSFVSRSEQRQALNDAYRAGYENGEKNQPK